ncbi:MAG: MFS transporter, partial [Actinomadura sp.]
MTSTASAPVPAKGHARFLVVALCFAAIVFDGYDLIVYGTVVPTLINGDEWALTPPEAGRIGSYALMGMLVGAAAVGTLTDVVGRRRIMIVCVTWFSLAMGLCALAPTPELFGAARFVAGIGLGGVVPTAIALTIEYAHPRHRSFTNGLMFCGYSVGGILAALIAIPLIPAVGWRAMFWLGMAPLVLFVPLAFALLPESPSFLLAKGRRAEAERLAARFGLMLDERDVAAATAPDRHETARSALAALFARGYAIATVLFGLGTAVGLLLVYGLNTWLAQIMREAGYPLGSALAFLLVLNLGAIVGTPLTGIAADRLGSKRVITVMLLIAAACIFLLSLRLPSLALYALVAVAGACTIGTT